MFKDYKNASTIQEGKLDDKGVLHIDTLHNSVHQTVAPTNSYGTGTGYNNPGYSVTTNNFPQEVYNSVGKGSSHPYA